MFTGPSRTSRHNTQVGIVTNIALDGRVGTEHVTDGLAQRLGAVEDAEHALTDIQAAVDEV